MMQQFVGGEFDYDPEFQRQGALARLLWVCLMRQRQCGTAAPDWSGFQQSSGPGSVGAGMNWKFHGRLDGFLVERLPRPVPIRFVGFAGPGAAFREPWARAPEGLRLLLGMPPGLIFLKAHLAKGSLKGRVQSTPDASRLHPDGPAVL